MTESTLRARPAAPAAELEHAGPIIDATVRRLACDASIDEVTVEDGGRPLSVGRSRRTIPPAIRRALVIRDRGCRFPGCDRPPAWTDAHHVVHWLDGGETDIGNLALLCRSHHRFVHEGGWMMTARDGVIETRAPP